jgi:hypothetical protein
MGSRAFIRCLSAAVYGERLTPLALALALASPRQGYGRQGQGPASSVRLCNRGEQLKCQSFAANFERLAMAIETRLQ